MKTIFIYFASLFMIASAADTHAQISTGNHAAEHDLAKASIAGKTHGEISLHDLLSATELKTNKQRVYVVEYKLTVVSTGGKEEFTGTGNKITEPMRFAFHNASSHAKINFENIKCINKDGSTYLLAPLSLELK